MVTKQKTDKEIKSMKEAGKILAHVLYEVESFAKVGHSTKDLADKAANELSNYPHASASFYGYQSFPHVMCVSVNDEIIHGIPNRKKNIQDGDVISIDFGVTVSSMVTDAARSFVVGKTSSTKSLLLNKTEESLMAGISVVKDTTNIKKVGTRIEDVLSKANLSIVKEFVGHGVGHELHEEPGIPNYRTLNKGFKLMRNMTIAIEPMATLGTEKIQIDDDGWTVRTVDGSLSAHFEDTVLVTEHGFEILTRP